MSEHEQLNERDREQVEERHEHGAEHYRKVYLTLLVLLVLSVAGPFLGIVWVTLITAFGIALVKANLVIQNFMHLRWEKRLVKWVLISSLVLMALFVAGVAPDVMRHEGQNWVNVAAADAVDRGIEDEHAEEEEHAEEGTAVTVADPDAFDAVGQFNLICARDDERIKTAIRDGGAAVGGSPLMAPWGVLFDDAQLDALVEYVKAFRPAGQ